MSIKQTIDYVAAKPENIEEVLDFMMENYLPSETITSALGAQANDEWRRYYKRPIDTHLKSGVSLLARDGNGGALAGLSLGLTVDAEEIRRKMDSDKEEAAKRDAVGSDEPPLFKDPVINRMLEFLAEATKGFDTSALFQHGGKTMFLQFLCVSPRYQRLGIAQTLMQRSLDTAKREKCKMFSVSGAGIQSQRLFEKMQFRVVQTIAYADIKDTKGRVYVQPNDGTLYNILYELKLD